MPNESFPKSYRLRTAREFAQVYAFDCYAADNVLVVNGMPNQLAHCRLGLAVSKKVGNAVLRNRWKRIIREAFRKQHATLPPGYDLVVRPKRGAEPCYPAVSDSIPRLVKLLARRVQSAVSKKTRNEPLP